ncbi:hypothetical protein [Laspinema olomoucense]|uniref:Uncharacterized protein n=1 Tax=Laspinema olomoucense D3b TaxID=2953688 RepID=A0ABT2N4B7_9CYAN|nr:hypothetical protein [Laspinema sp. D3b]MCT7977512.1 hypothetical protein [Laspinema sp. D3b]
MTKGLEMHRIRIRYGDRYLGIKAARAKISGFACPSATDIPVIDAQCGSCVAGLILAEFFR